MSPPFWQSQFPAQQPPRKPPKPPTAILPTSKANASTHAPASELPIDQGAAGLQQILLKLRTRASLLMIVAHPDDEDGGMLTYEARGQGVRAATLTV